MDGLYYKKFTAVPFTGKTTGRIQGSFKDGVLEGPYAAYYDSGRIRKKGTYVNGKEEGPWEFYLKTGKLKPRSGIYKNGVKVD